MIVWDQPTEPPATGEDLVFWRRYDGGDRAVSVPRHLEDHADRFRASYLAFIHDLGEHRINGRRIIDHLCRDGFSFWWMTLLAEKSPFKSPRIYDCLRLLALEDILVERAPASLTLVTGDSSLAQAVERLCRSHRVTFVRRRGGAGRRPRLPVFRRAAAYMPYALLALASLVKHLAVSRPLVGAGRAEWAGGGSAVTFFSYFVHLDPALCASGRFVSRQWTVLPDLVHEVGRATRWLHHFLISSAVPDAATGVTWVGRFNRDAAGQGRHAFLGTFLTPAVTRAALRNWWWLTRTAWHLRHVERAFSPKGTRAWLWPLLRGDWHSSLQGPTGMHNCLWMALFDVALAELTPQTLGLYVYENQGWERAMLHAWRKHGHGEIIGVQHATVPFWHLYYFDDHRSLVQGLVGAMPVPDRVALNGPAARRAFEAAGYPADRLIDVEALRYLDAPGPGPSLRQAGPGDGTTRVLVVGDLMPGPMQVFLEWLEDASLRLPAGFRFTFKPHPGYAPRLADYPRLRMEESVAPLDQILGDHDIVVAANSTSAAVDAYQAGVPTIVALDSSTLNLSPLRGLPDARFVGSPRELAAALVDESRRSRPGSPTVEFFHRDRGLSRWKELLGGPASSAGRPIPEGVLPV